MTGIEPQRVFQPCGAPRLSGGPSWCRRLTNLGRERDPESSVDLVRIAIISDIHGNLSAFEAVLADLRQMSPDLILHGGDLADSGSGSVEIVDRIRDLGWRGVFGNTDQMLFSPESLETFARPLPALEPLWTAIRDIAAATREAIGEERLAWLCALPLQHTVESLILLHAKPEDPWRAPLPNANDTELEAAYSSMSQTVVVYGHVHRPFFRRIECSRVPGRLVANSGSVGQPHDGDRRAAYLLLDDLTPIIRRVEYDVEREVRALSDSKFPHSDWIASILRSAAPQLP